MTSDNTEQEPVTFVDKRKIDPETGQTRDAEPVVESLAGAAAAPQPDSVDEGTQPETAAPETNELAERTADLQRLQAEYANYRRRVERDRAANREAAVAAVLTNFIPVLDDIGRAREHGELDGAFRAVGESLEQLVEKLGLTRYGVPGDAFDPTVHEALTHAHSDDVTEATCVEVFQPGYRIGDRVVRPARVAVAEPQ